MTKSRANERGDIRPPGAGQFEKLVFKPVPLWVVLLVLLLGFAILILYGAVLKSALSGNRRLGAASEAAVALADIPATIRQALAGANPMLAPEPRETLADGWSRPAGTAFVDNGYALISRYAPERNRSIVQLVRLSDGRVLRDYAPDFAEINRRSRLETPQFDLATDRAPSRYRMIHPELMPDGGLVFQGTSPLVRIDACGRVMWTLDGVYHHSIERDVDGNLLVPITRATPSRPEARSTFMEDGIAIVSPDGRLLREESLLAIFERNGLSWLYEGRPYTDDPFHLNDIEPATRSGPYWQRGDLFLSVRHLSMVLLYRPSIGRVLWWKQEPWLGQHDVSIIDDHRISVFDNNIVFGPSGDRLRGPNRMLIHDFARNALASPLSDVMRRLDMRTISEGRGTPLPNGDYFVEESNFGRLLRVAPDGQVRWQYISADAEGRRYMLNWSRYLNPSVYAPAIRAALSARCG